MRTFETKMLRRTSNGSANVSALRGMWPGSTWWIVGSGASLNHVPRTFFDDKLTIVVNEAVRDFHTVYAFAHHRETAQEQLDRHLIVVASDYDRCDAADGPNELTGGAWFSYHHPQQPPVLEMDLTPLEQEDDTALCVGSNTVTSAMDFAGRILGASAIVLCGVDGGSVDGRWNYDGYNGGGPDLNALEKQTYGGTGIPHVRAQEHLLRTMAGALRRRGVTVVSLNPFVNLGMEDHTYAR